MATLQDLVGALALFNRSIPLGDELADGAGALQAYATGKARTLPEAWDQARTRSSAAAADYARAHPVASQLVRGSGLAVQAVPFVGGATVAPSAGRGLVGAIARGSVAGGLGAQLGGLAGEGDLQNRAAAANAATPAAMAIGGALPGAVTSINAALRPPPRAPEPLAVLTGEEVAPYGVSTPELRSAVRDWYKNTLQGGTVPLGGPDGPPVGFNRTGREKSLSFSANPDKLRVFPALPDVIGKGRVVSEPPIGQVDPRVQGFHIVDGPVELNGEVVPMRVVVREMPEGHFHYDHAVRSAEGPAPSPGEPSLGRPAAGTPATKLGLPHRGAETLDPNIGVHHRLINLLAFTQGQASAER